MVEFVDSVKLIAIAGNGGDGCSSVHREKFKPLGGPDGGNGGDGGSVFIEASHKVTSLLDVQRRPHRRAGNGTQGMGDYRDGKSAEDLVVLVPVGTVVKDGDTVLADLEIAGDSVCVAHGGRGGLGNLALASKRRKAPGFALMGEPGEERTVELELKLLADVALVGFPSSGKSTLISAMSAARPKIAEYPFTTLVPNLGVVEAGSGRFTVADVPGLIEGAAEGRGLGHEFLRHIERCSVIAHVIDSSSYEISRNPLDDYHLIESELERYEQARGLSAERTIASKPRVVILNKVDMADGKEMSDLFIDQFREMGLDVYAVSALTRQNIKELVYGLWNLLENREFTDQEDRREPVVFSLESNKQVSTSVSKVEIEGKPAYQVRGTKPERWIAQTDFSNDEAVGYLADRLNAAGIEEELFELGATPGATVVIGSLKDGVIFDWEPTMTSGAELLGSRGSDSRVEEPTRKSRKERKQEYHSRMDAKEAARQQLRDEASAGLWTD